MSNTNTNTSNTTISTTAAAATSRDDHGGDTTSSTTCAACKYQRRKCRPDCILAPYFPSNQHKQFLNAHKLFGVSNIIKVFNKVKPCERETAMKSLIFEANVRAYDPVRGCHRIIRDLEREIYKSRAELQITLHQLAICRQNPNPSLVNPLFVSNPVTLQAWDSDYYGRSVSANPIQEQDTVSYNTSGIQMNMEGSSSSMLMGTQQGFVESEDTYLAHQNWG
ncbi:LOB domain-containing protein 22-like [Actinidia eriantha]|uniref:LOB domain-containing protein 22-like n=1 Tax=Actinidia eriantha TaxID=165200 RepID=UPI00258E36E2|nr:LOB domain-containing protein 22-like [Actinidia eriantha]